MFPTNRSQRRHPEMYGITFVNDPGDEAAGGGGAGTALLEREDVSGETDGADDGDTSDDADDDEGGDENAVGQADADADADKPLDPKIQAVIDARVAERLHEHETAAQQAAREAAEATAKAESAEKLKNLRTTRDTEIASIPVPGTDYDGNPVVNKLGDYAISKPVLDAIAKHDEQMEEHFGVGFRETQERNMLALLPDTEHEAAQKALDAATDYKAHAEAFGEAYAPHAKAIKEMGLDDLAALSPKANRELKERDAGIAKKARIQGQNDPDGEPDANGTSAGSAKNWDELRAGYGAGSLSDAETAAYYAERAKRDNVE